MATKRRFDIGDEVALRGIVRLLDVGGTGTVTIEIAATGQRMTVMADSTGVELVCKGQGGASGPAETQPWARHRGKSALQRRHQVQG